MNKNFGGLNLRKFNVKCESTLFHHDYQKFKILLKHQNVLDQSFIHDTRNHRVSCIDIRVFRYTKIHKEMDFKNTSTRNRERLVLL